MSGSNGLRKGIKRRGKKPSSENVHEKRNPWTEYKPDIGIRTIGIHSGGIIGKPHKSMVGVFF